MQPFKSKLSDAIIKHIENLIKYGQDKSSSLFVNAFELDSKKWINYDSDEVLKDTPLSNPVKQSNFFRLLCNLSILKNDDLYENLAIKVFAKIFNDFTDSNGLIFWGGHVAFDLLKQQIVYNPQKKLRHELKIDYPFYEIMWKTNQQKTEDYIEAFWNSHISNWENLAFNRHGLYNQPLGNIWNNNYKGGNVFFWDERCLTFVTTGSNLYYSAAMLSHFTNNIKPLFWSKTLANRYIETRQDPIGISGYQFCQSKTSMCNGPSIRGDRAQYQYAPYIPNNHLVYEGTIFRPIPSIQRCQLKLFETLGEKGMEFKDWAIEELEAWSKHAYRKEDNVFKPMLTDGYNLEGFIIQRNGYFGPKGRIEQPYKANSDFFWLYCMSCRYDNEHLWNITRNIALGNNLGDIGNKKGKRISLNHNYHGIDYKVLYGILELFTITKDEEYLNFAIKIGKRMLNSFYENGLFKTNENIVPVNNPIPLALLYLSSFFEEKSQLLYNSFY